MPQRPGAAGWVGLEQIEGWAPGPLVPDTPSVSVRLFKRKNRKTEKRVGAGQLGVLWQDRVQDFPLVVNNAPGEWWARPGWAFSAGGLGRQEGML